MNLVNFIHAHRAWSLRTFGPDHLEGVLDHIEEELEEIKAQPDDLFEWVDLIFLAMDGAWRTGYSPIDIASAMVQKQQINMNRKWPDWRTADTSKGINHIREGD